MVEYTLGAAARAVGVHKATLHRAVKSGRLSARRNEDGTYAIDAAELSRVYDVQPLATVAAVVACDSPQLGSATAATPSPTNNLQLIDELRSQLARERTTVDDLRARLDQSQEHISRLLLVLPAPTVPPTAVGSTTISASPLMSEAAPEATTTQPQFRQGFLARLFNRS